MAGWAEWSLERVWVCLGGGGNELKGQNLLSKTRPGSPSQSTWAHTHCQVLAPFPPPPTPQDPGSPQPAHPRDIFKQKERALSTTSISSPQPGKPTLWA